MTVGYSLNSSILLSTPVETVVMHLTTISNYYSARKVMKSQCVSVFTLICLLREYSKSDA